MKKRIWIITVVIVGVIIALIVYSALSGKERELVLETEVIRGDFEVAVMVTGELQALSETEIRGPSGLRSRNLRFSSVRIQSLVPEGTLVDSGEWVATLDRSESDNSLKDMMDELEQSESNFMRAKLDTTIELRNLRDELINLKFNMEEAKITLEQSKYEPPATIRQAEINLEKTTRAYEQAQKNYKLKVQQARSDVREAELDMLKDRREMDEMQEVLKQFDIMAPASGMVIYKRDWNGQKRTAGTEIRTWDPVVATLPDLSTLISQTYVNEIDISKIKVGQYVDIGVDAFPEKKYTGEVIEVANIGEQLPNTDAKVFEVRIEMNERDSILRPSMTTSNRILTRVFEDTLFIPLEAVRTNDTLSYVYTNNRKRQVVVLGESNENAVIVEQGLHEGDVVYLSTPSEPGTFDFAGLHLVSEIRKKEAERKAALDKQHTEPRQQMRRPEPGTQRPGAQRPQQNRN
jgi:hypothetical protein